jgi:hypothetical protein
MTVDDFLSRLSSVGQRGSRWSACCPAHDDRSPSLSISEGDKGLLLRCWAGCSVEEICTTLGLTVSDLFFDAGLPRSQRPAPRPPKLDRAALAWRYKLAALDRRLRAERIIQTGKQVIVATLTDEELDQAIGYMAQAYADVVRAELLEGVADTLRMRDFTERKAREQQPCAA